MFFGRSRCDGRSARDRARPAAEPARGCPSGRRRRDAAATSRAIHRRAPPRAPRHSRARTRVQASPPPARSRRPSPGPARTRRPRPRSRARKAYPRSRQHRETAFLRRNSPGKGWLSASVRRVNHHGLRDSPRGGVSLSHVAPISFVCMNCAASISVP